MFASTWRDQPLNFLIQRQFACPPPDAHPLLGEMYVIQSSKFSMFEASNSGEATNCGSCNMDNGDRHAYPYKFQLEYDVQRLQQHLQEEMELHAILENAFEHTSPSSSGLSSLPQCAKELLSSIATLEITVSKLEQEMVSLHFQLSQERNERRLVEYRLKHSPFSSLSVISEDNMKKLNAVVSGALVQEKRVSTQGIQHSSVGSLTKKIPNNDLCIHPNRLSEEMVRCMKDIFISLADSSCLSSAATVIHDTPLSPYGHLSYSSLWSSFERSTILSLADSPKHDLQCVSQLLPAEKICDPYNVRGKLSWANIGNYGLAVEVSWMSVGKKQLEYAAGALQKFRSLVEQLVVVNPNHLNCNEKLAFWINLYNTLSMHAYLAYGVPRSELKLFSLMQKVAYTIGGHSVSAAAIEYVILRMNPPVHRPQTALLLALNKLKVPEEQRSFSIDTAEPLVVFALSCGMYSSPAVQIYTAKNVRTELQEAQRDFIRASVGMSSNGRLLVPKLAHCFARNFIDDAILAVWISSYLPPDQATFIEQCMSKRRQSFLGSHNCGILPFDSRFRYLFLPDEISS